ncbi:transcriptional regulator [Polaromonas sp.]|uniref:transcriptional regulator n=1 Tax=Polaromonas sp. TaxID=1869339 RepID=UPI00352A8F6C
MTQQEFLQQTAQTLGISERELATRMGAPWATFEKWILPPEAAETRDMPDGAWSLAREILAHAKQEPSAAKSPDDKQPGK